MIYVTGDKHRNFESVEYFCDEHDTSKDDVLVVLGDAGVNYLGPRQDRQFKEYLSRLPITFVFIRGNHERRPYPLLYTEKEVSHPAVSGRFYVEHQFPSLLFAIDGQSFSLDGHPCFPIGGAYSVDKFFRLASGRRWFEDEQLSEEERFEVSLSLKAFLDGQSDPVTILTHTCPFDRLPTESFLPGIDQSTVDNSTEIWLNEVYAELPESAKWFCGHYHVDKVDGNVRFMYRDILPLF